MIYRFGSNLYFANAAKLMEDVMTLVDHGAPLRWMVLDCAAIEDVDYTASAILTRAVDYLRQRHVRMAASSVLDPVRRQFDRYGISKALDPGAWYDSAGEAFEALHTAGTAPGDGSGPGSGRS